MKTRIRIMVVASMSIFTLSSCQSGKDANFWWAMSVISGAIIDDEDQSRYRTPPKPDSGKEDSGKTAIEDR